jgi:hypothetical protein
VHGARPTGLICHVCLAPALADASNQFFRCLEWLLWVGSDNRPKDRNRSGVKLLDIESLQLGLWSMNRVRRLGRFGRSSRAKILLKLGLWSAY